jgi:hypothetical protein
VTSVPWQLHSSDRLQGRREPLVPSRGRRPRTNNERDGDGGVRPR